VVQPAAVGRLRSSAPQVRREDLAASLRMLQLRHREVHGIWRRIFGRVAGASPVTGVIAGGNRDRFVSCGFAFGCCARSHLQPAALMKRSRSPPEPSVSAPNVAAASGSSASSSSPRAANPDSSAGLTTPTRHPGVLRTLWGGLRKNYEGDRSEVRMKTDRRKSGDPAIHKILRTGWQASGVREPRNAIDHTVRSRRDCALGFAVVVHLQPPTVIHVDSSGNATVVGRPASVNPDPATSVVLASQIGADATDAAPYPSKGKQLLRRFLEHYLAYTPESVDRSFAESLNMMTTNLRTSRSTSCGIRTRLED